jgi:hypothetical protein
MSWKLAQESNLTSMLVLGRGGVTANPANGPGPGDHWCRGRQPLGFLRGNLEVRRRGVDSPGLLWFPLRRTGLCPFAYRDIRAAFGRTRCLCGDPENSRPVMALQAASSCWVVRDIDPKRNSASVCWCISSKLLTMMSPDKTSMPQCLIAACSADVKNVNTLRPNFIAPVLISGRF